MRFLMVDRIASMEVGASVSGFKCWSVSDDVFRDHFPGTPIVPGVLLIESMAQLCGFLLSNTYRARFGHAREVGAILAMVHRAKFRRFVVPGDRVDMAATLVSFDAHRAACRIRGTVASELRTEAELSFVFHTWDPADTASELRMHRESYERLVFADLRQRVSDAFPA